MDIIDKLKLAFRNGNTLTRLIYINAGIYILLQVLILMLRLFNLDAGNLITYLSLPSDVNALLSHFWTLLTYMFLHERLFHILFNMLALYWFGKLFLMYFTEKQMVSLYLIGGFAGALFYVVAYNVFPYFEPYVQLSLLMGASASVIAMIVAVAVQSPNMELRMLFIGNIKLKYIALFTVLTSFFGITSNNAGGEIAHLGGAFAGYIFIVSLRQGKDITKWLNKLLDALYNLFKPRKLKVVSSKKSGRSTMSDAEFNMNKARRMAEIDHILDKIKTSGYESLSVDEKKKLFEQGKK